MESKIKILFVLPPNFLVPGTIFDFNTFKNVIKDKIDLYIENPENLTVVTTMD